MTGEKPRSKGHLPSVEPGFISNHLGCAVATLCRHTFFNRKQSSSNKNNLQVTLAYFFAMQACVCMLDNNLLIKQVVPLLMVLGVSLSWRDIFGAGLFV